MTRGRGRGWHGDKPGHQRAAKKGQVTIRELPGPKAMDWRVVIRKLKRPRPYGAAIGEAKGGFKYTHEYTVKAGDVLIAQGVATSHAGAKFRGNRTMKRSMADPLSVIRARRAVVK